MERPAKLPRATVPTARLNNGRSIPVVGLGTWKSAPLEQKEAVKAAILCGYRHIDCAAIYGNEAEVGEGIKESGCSRDDLFITSKLWNACHKAEDVEPSCRESLSRLGIDYLDLYLIHWPVCLRKGHTMPPAPADFIDISLEETWRAMESLVERGLCKAIGVSNFAQPRIEQILSFAEVKPAMLQIEGHPYLQQPKLKEFCDRHGILVTAYSPLGSPDRPPRLFEKSDPILMEDETLAEISKSAGRSPAGILLRWAVQRGTIVIPKSVTPTRIESNLAEALNPLSDDAMKKLEKMDRHLRLLKVNFMAPPDTTGPIKHVNRDLWEEAPLLRLNNGDFIPPVGLGTWQSRPGQVQEAVKVAISCGYRHIDCASFYNNEAEVGEGIKESGISRKEIFVTSKLWNDCHSAADVEKACRSSLEKLGTDYLDLYLIHWPVCLRKGFSMPPGAEDFTDVPVEETWKAMEGLVEKGLCKAIGCSNFSAKKIEHIVSFAKVKPVMNQVEAHPYLQQPRLKDFCDKHGILISGYAPLGSGGRPRSLKKDSHPVLLDDDRLKKLAEETGRTPADICLRWAVQRGCIVLPKSVTAERIVSNFNACYQPLPEEVMKQVGGMDQHLRFFDGTVWTPEGTKGPLKDVKTDLWNE